jgi:hypothetical protein
MEKLYIVVDAEAPADESIVIFDGGASVVDLSFAEEFVAANQKVYDESIVLGDGTEITQRYHILEAKPGEEENA